VPSFERRSGKTHSLEGGPDRSLSRSQPVWAGQLGRLVGELPLRTRRSEVDDERRAAGHRYEVAQGFQPERMQLAGRLERAGARGSKRADGWGAVAGLAFLVCGGLAEAASAVVCLGSPRNRSRRSGTARLRRRRRRGLPAKVQDAILRRALAFEQLFELSRRAFEMQAEG
jgi:hypothetical protein